MLYTSYYAMLRYLPQNMVRVAISNTVPSWYKMGRCIELSPTQSILREYKKTGDVEKYTKRFKDEVLSKMTQLQAAVYLQTTFLGGGRDFFWQGNGADIVLLCYEKPTDFCHRHLVAEWLTKGGFKCEEWIRPVNGGAK